MAQYKNVEGFEEVKQVFDRFPSIIQKKVLSSANRAGAQVIRKEAIARLNGRGISNASKKVVIRKSKYSTEESPSVLVGNHKDAYELGIMERGASTHIIEAIEFKRNRQIKSGAKRKTKRRGKKVLADAVKGIFFGTKVKHPGFIALPWLRPAADTKKGDALKTTAAHLKKGIEREALKLAGKYKPRRRRR
tara:strand:+ start:235 stop:807 length:573 start_codon:yes stop_codon:yes gene_type:complete